MTPSELVRQAVHARLVADFDTVNQVAAASYGVPSLDIGFSYPSRNFLFGRLDPVDFDASTAAIELPGMTFYVSECVFNPRGAKSHLFTGEVIAHLDTYLVYRAIRDEQQLSNTITERMATFDPELLINCAEESLLHTLRSADAMTSFGNAGCLFTDYKFVREPLDAVGDGISQLLAMTLGFTVHVR